ncbi:hypothetical protein HG530_009450 [Fusarium avenaceum]|nr:hypothetical protein HG530_009450 [Fusarium avenaceum]
MTRNLHSPKLLPSLSLGVENLNLIVNTLAAVYRVALSAHDVDLAADTGFQVVEIEDEDGVFDVVLAFGATAEDVELVLDNGNTCVVASLGESLCGFRKIKPFGSFGVEGGYNIDGALGSVWFGLEDAHTTSHVDNVSVNTHSSTTPRLALRKWLELCPLVKVKIVNPRIGESFPGAVAIIRETA